MSNALQGLKDKNPTININKIATGHLVTKPWNDETISFMFPDDVDVTQLNQLKFLDNLIAISHTDDNAIEFIYAPVSKNKPIFNRSFAFNYNGLEFNCSFAPILPALKLLADSFDPIYIDSSIRHSSFRLISEFINHPEVFGDSASNAEVISFFVKGPFSEIGFDYIGLSKSINFYMRYFHRETPCIHILPQDEDQKKHARPCYNQKQDFPKTITSVNIDPTILDIFEVASETESPRLSFIFYFQILEYCSYYYLSYKLHQKLQFKLRQPDVASNSEVYVRSIIEDMKDNFSQKDDSVKLEQVLTQFCSIDDIKEEIECNASYFCSDVVFEGGLEIPRLLNHENEIQSLTKDKLRSIKRNIESIRNVLVHLRESRENKVILPTRKNDELIMPYLHCVRRLAEKVAIQFKR